MFRFEHYLYCLYFVHCAILVKAGQTDNLTLSSAVELSIATTAEPDDPLVLTEPPADEPLDYYDRDVLELSSHFKVLVRKCCPKGEAFFLERSECASSSLELNVPVFLTLNSLVVNLTENQMHLDIGPLTVCEPTTMSSEEFLLLDNGELFSTFLNERFGPESYCLENAIDGPQNSGELIAAYCPFPEALEQFLDPVKIPIRKCCPLGEVVSYNNLHCELAEDHIWKAQFHELGFIKSTEDRFINNYEAASGYPECLSVQHGEMLDFTWNYAINYKNGQLWIPLLNISTGSYCIDDYEIDSEILSFAYACLSEEDHRKYLQATPFCQSDEDFCVDKCCQFGEVLNIDGQCVPDARFGYHTDMLMYFDNNTFDRVENVDFNFGFPRCQGRGLFITQLEEKAEILSNGSLRYVSYDPLECDPYISQIIAKGDFCHDMIQFPYHDASMISGALICYPELEPTYHLESEVNYIYVIFLIISDIFILLSFIIYLTVPDQAKRGLNKNIKLGHSILGRILLCFLFSLFFAYLCLIITKTSSDPINIASHNACISLGIVMYISFLATFFWLNVLCFELWWKCARQERSSGRRWLWYQVYAWGSPLLMGAVTLFIEFYSEIGPCFVKPHFGLHSCFFSETRTYKATAKWVYMNGPVAALLLADLVFFLLTVKSLLQTVQQSHKGTARRQARQRLKLSFKLFLVMGICWLAEIISVATNTKMYITEVFNCLQGFVIFLIFILKPKILEATRARFCSRCCGREPTDGSSPGRLTFTASSVLFDFFSSTRHHPSVSSSNPSISSNSTATSSISSRGSTIRKPGPQNGFAEQSLKGNRTGNDPPVARVLSPFQKSYLLRQM